MDYFIAGETEINLKKAIRFTLLLIANADPQLLRHVYLWPRPFKFLNYFFTGIRPI